MGKCILAGHPPLGDAALAGRVGALENRAGSLEARAGTVESRASSLEGRANSLEGRVGTAETQINALKRVKLAFGTALPDGNTSYGGVDLSPYGFTSAPAVVCCSYKKPAGVAITTAVTQISAGGFTFYVSASHTPVTWIAVGT